MLSLPNQEATIYRVEVSGWDSQENFFVEKTSLEWSEDKGKRVFLRSPVHRGSVVFVRLLGGSTYDAIPLAYQVAGVHRGNGRGAFEVSLVQLRPTGDKPAPEESALIGSSKQR